MMIQTSTFIIHCTKHILFFSYYSTSHSPLSLSLSLSSSLSRRIFAVSIVCPGSQSARATAASPAPLPRRVVVGRCSHSNDHHRAGAHRHTVSSLTDVVHKPASTMDRSVRRRRCVLSLPSLQQLVSRSGGRSFVSESCSQRSTMSRNCVDKVEGGRTTSAAILNNALGLAGDVGDAGSRWASLEHHARRRRSHRLPAWTASADLDDDQGPSEDGRDDDEVADSGWQLLIKLKLSFFKT